MARLQRLTMAEYAREFVIPQFCRNHMLWLAGCDSEVLQVWCCKHPKLYRVQFADRTESVVDHLTVCFLQILPGTLNNRVI